jgi:hypothetical protein
LTVRTPSRVVTTTFETRGLLRKVRVSVRTPFSFLTVISELSGAVVVVATSFALALALAFEFDVDSLLQLAVRTASEAIATL